MGEKGARLKLSKRKLKQEALALLGMTEAVTTKRQMGNSDICAELPISHNLKLINTRGRYACSSRWRRSSSMSWKSLGRSTKFEPRYFSFDELESTDEETKNLLIKYHYEVRWHQNGYAFRPGDSVPEMENKYHVLLPMTASVGSRSQRVDIPVRLLGEPFDPMKDWNKEFRGLCETAIRYFPGDVAHGYVQYIKEHFSDPALWDKSELRAMRHEVIRAAQVYWTKQYEYQMRLVAYYDLTEIIFKKPSRFIGDTAFKIVVRFYYGENENWITPCKDLIVDTIDEALWSYAETGTADWNFTENLLAQCTNTIENYISIADSKGTGLTFGTGNKDTRQLAFALCGFAPHTLPKAA